MRLARTKWTAALLTAALASAAPAQAADPVIAAAGDIACDPASSSFKGGFGSGRSCRQRYVSDLLVGAGLSAVLALGDVQYACGSLGAFMQSYDRSWGRVKAITRPAVGNHEHLTSGGTGCDASNTGAAGYYNYFGAAAGPRGKGYYSYDIGSWHLIALNTNCTAAGGCGASSPQGRWLAADLAANRRTCTLAYWHIPLYSSGGRAYPNSKSFWQQLHAAGADVVLSAHDHIYERFAPQDADARRDDRRGITQFSVGTGGANHTTLPQFAVNSIVRDMTSFGVLKMALHPTGYTWQFVPEAGAQFRDWGSRRCNY